MECTRKKYVHPHVYAFEKQGVEETSKTTNKQTQQHGVEKGDDAAVNHGSLASGAAAAHLWFPSFSGVILASHLQEALITM